MANWNEILLEINTTGSTFDVTRRKYLHRLNELTGRNVIAYYSGWLEKPGVPAVVINDADKNGLMNAIYQLDKTVGLDLILHTPGGDVAATESIVDYLRSMFGYNIRAIVPQLAMSGGTMIACACKEILMGKQSSLGPIDPQYQGLSAHGVVEEFQRAYQEIKADQSRAFVWQPILAKYPPAFVGECEKAIRWSGDIAFAWLVSGMFKGRADAESVATAIVKELVDHSITLSHSRHLSATKCKEMGLVITTLEEDQKLQDAVLSVHHAFVHTLSGTAAFKIIENHLGAAYVQQAIQTIQVPAPH